MKWDVESVRPLANFMLDIVLRDGRKGVFDMKPYLNFGAFKQLREPGYFEQVSVQFDAVTWPQGQDIAPDTLMARMHWLALLEAT